MTVLRFCTHSLYHWNAAIGSVYQAFTSYCERVVMDMWSSQCCWKIPVKSLCTLSSPQIYNCFGCIRICKYVWLCTDAIQLAVCEDAIFVRVKFIPNVCLDRVPGKHFSPQPFARMSYFKIIIIIGSEKVNLYIFKVRTAQNIFTKYP